MITKEGNRKEIGDRRRKCYYRLIRNHIHIYIIKVQRYSFVIEEVTFEQESESLGDLI